VIELRQVQKHYAAGLMRASVLRGIDLSIRNGEFVALLGPSGCGKSTLLSILGLLLKPTSGEYLFEGKDVTGLRDVELSRLRNEHIGFIFQLFHLIPRVSVLDNVLLPTLYAHSFPHDAKKRAIARLESLGLGDRLGFIPEALSGGQQQRVAIARALMNRPALILADEPTGNLDHTASQEVMQAIAQLHIDGTTVVLVTHDLTVASFAHRVVRLGDGVLVDDLPRSERPRSES